MKELYVVNCCRTAIGSFGGSLKDVPATELGAIVVKEALNRAGVKPEQVDEVMFGCILTAAQGQNVARQVSIKAGIPFSVPAYTVGMVCGSGMKSVIEGARSILAGDADVIVCGGTENMSAAPYAVPTGRYGARMGHTQMLDTMIKDGLWDAYNNYHMGTTAENIADVWGITRQEMDEFAASSQQKACAARDSGRFDDEVVPVMVKQKKQMVEFKRDEFPREGVTAESISKLRGAFPVGPEGVEDEIVHTFEPTEVHEADTRKHEQRVTAANASGINDGAAAIVLASGEAVEKYGLKPMAKLIGWGQGRHCAGLRRGGGEVRPEAHGQAGLLGPGGRGSQDHGRGPRPGHPSGHGESRPEDRGYGPGGGQRGLCRPVHRRGPRAPL